MLEEFRIIAGKKAFDLEQFVEQFDPSTIKLPHRLPAYLVIDDDDEVGINLFTPSVFLRTSFSSSQNESMGELGVEEDGSREAVDKGIELKRSLLYPAKGAIISADVVYNKNLRYILSQ